MKKFLVLYQSPIDAMKQMASSTPEQQAKGMEMWMSWAKKCGAHLVDLGAPLVNAKRLSPGAKISVAKNQVTGYSILQAEDMDELTGLMEGHPHISGWNPEATIEIHESMPIPGM